MIIYNSDDDSDNSSDTLTASKRGQDKRGFRRSAAIIVIYRVNTAHIP